MEIVGGYRLVRKLGSGPRAEVFLGHAGGSATPRVAALKLYRAGTGIASIDTEIEALGRACSRHLLPLRDLATDASGRPCLIVQRLAPSTLAAVLIERDRLLVGEAVTILAPLALAVGELHRVGVAHGAVRASNVLFDDAGAPVLTGFGTATLIGSFPASAEESSLTVARLSEDPAVQLDLAGLGMMCRAVLDRTLDLDPHRKAELYHCLNGSGPASDAQRFPADLAERLFDLGDPLPVGVGAGPGPVAMRRIPAVPERTAPVPLRTPAAPQRTPAADRAVHRWELAASSDEGPAAAAAVEPVETPITAFPGRVRAALAATRGALAGVRRSVWVAAITMTALLVLAVVVMPETAPPVIGDSDSRAEVSASPWPGPGPVPAAVGADEPVAAVRALLERRAACLQHRSVPCLHSVDQADSAVLENDKRLTRSATTAAQPAAVLFAVADATLIERLGDSALVSLTPAESRAPNGGPSSGADSAEQSQAAPVAVLAIRTNEGWRLRDILIG